MAESAGASSTGNGIRTLLQRARAGDSAALGKLLESCRGYLLGIANREMQSGVRPKAGPSDVVQQSFLQAKQGLERFDGTSEEELLAWLRRILLNNLANVRRHYAAEKRQIARERPMEAGSSNLPMADAIRASGHSPSSILANREEAEMLVHALECLPEDHRQVIQWRYWDRLSFGEIGRRMDRTPNAVRKLWLRAVERLYREMEKARHERVGRDP